MGRVKSTMGPNIWLWGLELPPEAREILGNQREPDARLNQGYRDFPRILNWLSDLWAQGIQ